MKFRITFQYMDGESKPMDVHPDDMKELMRCVGCNEVYFNPERGVGVWVNIDKVRYFDVESVDDDGNRVTQARHEIPLCDEQSRDQESNSEH